MSQDKAWMAWSSGKDSAWALHSVRQKGEVEISGMLSTVTRPYERVSMHGVREELLKAQAEAAGLPLHTAYIPAPCTDEQYREVMSRLMLEAKEEGVSQVIFGDLFLEDVRCYREENLRQVELEAVLPLWGRDTRELAEEMLEGGLRAVITCLDPRKVPRELAGRFYDRELLDALPEGVDPCAENGEFHTFCFAGPIFSRPIEIEVGETVEREGFVFTDVLAARV